MYDGFHYYKEQAREIENANNFIRKSTLGIILNKLNWLKENGGNIDHAIEYIIMEMRK